MARSYVVDLPGGTATTSVQIQTAGSMKDLMVAVHSAAVGKLEISTSATSQIGTAAPDKSVLYRLNQSGTAGDLALAIPSTGVSFKAFDMLYFHQTGAGNLGSVSFRV